MRYIDKIETLPSTDADNALIIGTAMHIGIEKGIEEGIKAYYDSFPIITDEHINEAIKLEYLIPKVKEILPEGKYELQIMNSDFVGFIDLTSRNDDGSYDIYDFKYSNNTKGYMDSGQLHLYKYFYEKQFKKKIRNLNFVFIPKVNIKQKSTENIISFRKRIIEELEASEIKVVQVQFNIEKVIEFYQGIKRVLETKEFPKEPSYLCNYCEYQDYCQKGWDYMLLPKNERRNIQKIEKKVIWIYGAPFSGKTTFANKFPYPLMLNTDGNIKFVDAPYIAIKDKVEPNGRMSPKRTFAWDVFKEVIEELEKKENDFKTIIVDLLEDCYEHCRLYMYDQMGITHESDDSFRAWDKVQTEFLSTLKRLMNLDYENIILISHEDTSKDITKKGGDKITAIKPNLREKVANKVAGMVDIVARVIADDNVRTLSFKTNEVIFGGGRLVVSTNEIPLDYEAFLEIYDEANKNAVAVMHGEEPVASASTSAERRGRQRREKTSESEPEAPKEETSETESAENGTGTASNDANTEGGTIKQPTAPTAAENAEQETQKPVTKTRKRRGE